VHVLIATDADWVKNEVVAALGGPDTSFTVCREGRDVVSLVAKRTPDLAVLDLQVGSMGAMAVTMALRHDESAGLGPRVPILMLLDRIADVHLARRSGADGWIIKPLDALRLMRAARTITSGGSYTEPVAPRTASEPMATHDESEVEPGVGEEAGTGDPVTSG
jgi:DNA-binding response OmpR family regulator